MRSITGRWYKCLAATTAVYLVYQYITLSLHLIMTFIVPYLDYKLDLIDLMSNGNVLKLNS